MKPRFLALVPVGLAVAMLLIATGPYTDIAAALGAHSMAPFEEAAVTGAGDVESRLAVLTASQRDAYADWQWTDIGVALANTLVVVVLLLVPARGIGVPGAIRWFLVGLALLPLIAELLEGGAIRDVVDASSESTEAAASLLAFATTMKWWTLGICGIVILALWLGWPANALARRARNRTSD